jgi:hypothetical protein
MATKEELEKKFHSLDKAMAGLKAIIAVDTAPATDVRRAELTALVEKVNAAQALVTAKKAEIEQAISSHEMSAKFQAMKAERAAVVKQLVAVTGKEEWWK